MASAEWWHPLMPFAGSVLLFVAAMITLWRTNKAAEGRHREQMTVAKDQHDADLKAAEDRYLADQNDMNSRHYQDIKAAQERQEEQLSAMRGEGRADRAAARADRFREDVAGILAERWPTLDAAMDLADAVAQYREHRENREVPPQERAATFDKVRLGTRENLNRFIQLVIRASLLTNDPDVLAILKGLRDSAKDAWNAMKGTLNGDGDPYEKEAAFRETFNSKLTDLETATRRLVTSEPVTNTAVDPSGG